MKKLILAIVVIAMIAICGSVEGTFEVTYPLTADFNDSILPNYVYILRADGTFDIDTMGEVSTDGRWVMTEQTENSITYELAFKGEPLGVLTLYEGNTFLTSSIKDGEILPLEADGTWYVGEPVIEQIEVSGYQSYVDAEYEFSILYPETWEISNFYSQEEAKTIEYTGTPIGILQEGQEAGIGFKSDILNSIGQPQATIMVMVVSDSEQARTWETEEFQKMGGAHSEVVIHGKHGDEVLVHPFPGVTTRQVVFAAGDLYYTVMVYANEGMYNRYADIFDTAINSFDCPAPIVATPTPAPSTTPSAPAAEAPEEPGFEAVFTIAGLLVVTHLLLKRRK